MFQIFTDFSMVCKTVEILFFFFFSPSGFYSILFPGILLPYWLFLSLLWVCLLLCSTSNSWIPQEMSLFFIFSLVDIIPCHNFKYFNSENHSFLFPADYSMFPDGYLVSLKFTFNMDNRELLI